MALSDEDIREILRIIDESELDELRVETAGFSLHVRKRSGSPPEPPSAGNQSVTEPASAGSGRPLEPPSAGNESPTEPASAGSGRPLEPASGASSEPPSAAVAPRAEPEAETAPQPKQRDGLHTIKSPMLGTFYRAEAPGALPFVEVGSQVEPDSTVCLIEVMKMMNSIPAGVSGTIAEVCPQNAELIEYGAPLFRVQPA
jgi:acetyl-CoA carboxylase biotin carboxyl carrier protein